MHKPDSALWLGLGGLMLTAITYFILRDNPNDASRILLTLLALVMPILLLIFLEQKFIPSEWVGEIPDAATIFLSGAAGLSLWSISWWVMSYLDQQLYQAVGFYLPVFVHLNSWSAEVIYFVVLLPLLTTLLVFGIMRGRLASAPRPLAIGLLTLYFAIAATLTTPQGLVALVGYGLLGAVAAFLSLETRSVLAGLAAYGTFMFANLAFLDNLMAELGTVSYGDTRWLTLILFSALMTLALIQVIRFRQVPPAKPSKKTSENRPTFFGYAALVGVLLVVLFYAANELDQRNEQGKVGAVNSPVEELARFDE